MRQSVLSAIVLLAYCAIGSAADPPSGSGNDLDKVLGELRESARRVNGVQLTITAELKRDMTHEIDVVHIRWTLDYNGPRPPLVIQKPKYPEHSYYATRIRVLAPGKSRLVPVIHLEGKPPLGIHLQANPLSEDYVNIANGKSASGVIALPLGEIKHILLAQWPKEIAKKPPDALYIQLLHFPKERGEQLGLDAWTAGTATTSGLYSAPVKIDLSKW